MNSNDVLAQIAGLTEETELIDPDEQHQDYDEINYDEVDAELFESFENKVTRKEVTGTRRTRTAHRELQGLQFANPGDEMSRFLPDSSDIINTNRSKRVVTEKQADLREEPLHHDKTGKLSCTTKGQTEVYDLCDCLNPNCDGCNWPCKQCKSRKCLVGCRQNRKDMVVKVQEMYTVQGSTGPVILTNLYFPHQIKD